MKPSIVFVTHNNCEVPLNAACEQDITDYFFSFDRYKGNLLHTYGCVTNVAHFDPIRVYYLDDIEVVCQENYKKTLVHATASLKHIECDVMFIMCHGGGGPSPLLAFYDDQKDHWTNENDPDEVNMLTLWARHKDTEPTKAYAKEGYAKVSMSEVVDKTKMVVLMSCCAGDIVKAYFEEKPATSQQFFYFSSVGDDGHFELSSSTIEIVLSLLLNVVDCIDCIDVASVASVKEWRDSILQVMKIVKLFGVDHEAFWDYLVVAGVTLPLDVSKKRQQILTVEKDDERWFRIAGHRLDHFLYPATKKTILSECRTLTLATWDASSQSLTYLTVDSPELGVIEFCDDPSIDTFLKEYATKETRPFKRQRVGARLHTQDSLAKLLVQLKLV